MNRPDLFTPPPFRFDGNPTGEHLVGNQSDARHTLAARVAALLKSRPGEWIDGREFMQVAGSYGWRTRLSDCRRAPYFLTIENRQRRQGRYTVSEYRLVVTPEATIGGAA